MTEQENFIDRMRRIYLLLWPADSTRCAEPLDIEDSRWIVAQFEQACRKLTGKPVRDKAP